MASVDEANRCITFEFPLFFGNMACALKGRNNNQVEGYQKYNRQELEFNKLEDYVLLIFDLILFAVAWDFWTSSVYSFEIGLVGSNTRKKSREIHCVIFSTPPQKP